VSAASLRVSSPVKSHSISGGMPHWRHSWIALVELGVASSASTASAQLTVGQDPDSELPISQLPNSQLLPAELSSVQSGWVAGPGPWSPRRMRFLLFFFLLNVHRGALTLLFQSRGAWLGLVGWVQPPSPVFHPIFLPYPTLLNHLLSHPYPRFSFSTFHLAKATMNPRTWSGSSWFFIESHASLRCRRQQLRHKQGRTKRGFVFFFYILWLVMLNQYISPPCF